MDFDPKIFDEIKNMDQGELDKKIGEIALALNVDARMIKRLLGDQNSIRKKLDKLNAADIQKMSKRLDPEKLEAIKRCFE